MKFFASVTRRASSLGSLEKAGKSNRTCESGCRRGRSQITRGIRKRCRIRAGWRHEWIPRTELPSKSVLAIHEVVRGPFSSPRLVNASPYVFISSYCKNGDSESCKSTGRCPQIKRGIPDPWAEYLACRGFCSKDDQRIVRRDLELGCKNIYVTARVWKDLGLPLGQGIPDPWKIPVGRNKWVGEKGVKLYPEKRCRQKIYQYCEYCKRCQASTRISSPGGYCHVNETALGDDSILLNPRPQQETNREKFLQQETLQQCQNFSPEASSHPPGFQPINKSQECTAPCNTHPYNDRPSDVITKPSAPTTQPSIGAFPTFPGRPECSNSRGEQLTLGKSEQQIPKQKYQVCGTKIFQERKTANNLINSGVQTSETVPVVHSTSTFIPEKFFTPGNVTQITPLQLNHDFRKRQVDSSLNKITAPFHSCGCSHQDQFPVQDAACACDSSDFRKKRVGFENSILPCTETICNHGKQKLNVTQLSCGCVHISPCFGMQGNLEAGIGYADFGPKGGSPCLGDAFHGKSLDQTCCGCIVPKSNNPKPKMISRMKRLLNRYKPTNRTRRKTGQTQTVTSEICASKIPDEARLVCCECNCPYLRIRDSSQEAPSKTVAKKKGKCACGRCVAKRERREKHRSRKAAAEEQKVGVSPRSCERRVQVERDQRLTMKCHNESCRMQYCLSRRETLREGAGSPRLRKQKDILKKEESYSPSAPQRDSIIIDEMKGSYKVTEKFSGDVNSPEAWRYPAVFGTPWYSSDSGENADVSEASRHTVQCTSMLAAPPETSLVTSCTFISRINHSTVFQCMKKHRKISKREERLNSVSQHPQEIDSEPSISRNSLRVSNALQIPRFTNGSSKSEIISHQIPLPHIEELGTQDSKKTPTRITCIDLPLGCVSFYKDEETSGTSRCTNRDKKREDGSGTGAKSRKKQVRKKSDGSTVNGSQITVDVDPMTSYNRLGHSPSQRSHLVLPKTELVLDETENLTDAANDKLILPDSFTEIRELKNSANPESICDSSNSTHSLRSDLQRNSGHEPMITTIVSPRKISTNSSTSCNRENCTRKCRIIQVPMNTPTDGASSEDQGLPLGKENSIVYRCELPSTKGSRFAKSTGLSDNTDKSFDSTPRYRICSPAKVDGFLEGEGMENFDLNSIARTEKETPREFVEEVRTLVRNGIYEDGNKSSTDNKCYLKYCSLRRSGPCVISPSRKILRIQHPSYISNENDEDDIPEIRKIEFPLGRRACSSSSNQKNLTTVQGDAFTRVSTHSLAKVQDKFNIG